MRQTLTNYLRRQVQPALLSDTPTGKLDEHAHATIYALFEILCDDTNYPPELVAAHVNHLTEHTPGYFHEFQQGLKLLKRKSIFGAFEDLPAEERQRVIHSILRTFPHIENNAWWRQLLRLTSQHIDTLAAPQPAVRFRHFVARPLLALYYRGQHGWAVVGYDKYPGMTLADNEPSSIVNAFEDHGRILIQLNDETIEVLHLENIVTEFEAIKHINTKGGKQVATLDPQIPSEARNLLRQFIRSSTETVHQTPSEPTPRPEFDAGNTAEEVNSAT